MVSVRGFTATPPGTRPTRIVRTTVFVRPLMTDTVPLFALATSMVTVRGFSATPTGTRPTGIVDATVRCLGTARAGLPAPETDAAALAVVAAGTIAAIVAVTTMTERLGRFMMSCSLVGPAGWRHPLSRRRVIPISQTLWRAGLLQQTAA